MSVQASRYPNYLKPSRTARTANRLLPRWAPRRWRRSRAKEPSTSNQFLDAALTKRGFALIMRLTEQYMRFPRNPSDAVACRNLLDQTARQIFKRPPTHARDKGNAGYTTSIETPTLFFAHARAKTEVQACAWAALHEVHRARAMRRAVPLTAGLTRTIFGLARLYAFTALTTLLELLATLLATALAVRTASDNEERPPPLRPVQKTPLALPNAPSS